jgi:hypothetical protein
MEISWHGLHVFYTYICTPKSISNGAQYVTPYTVKFIATKAKCAGLAQKIGFSAPTFVQLAAAGKRHNTVVHLQKRV